LSTKQAMLWYRRIISRSNTQSRRDLWTTSVATRRCDSWVQ